MQVDKASIAELNTEIAKSNEEKNKLGADIAKLNEEKNKLGTDITKLNEEKKELELQLESASKIRWPMPSVESITRKGESRDSPAFTALGIPGFRLKFYPQGEDKAQEGCCSLFLHIPAGTIAKGTLFVDDCKRDLTESIGGNNWGFNNFVKKETYSEVS